MIKEELSSLCIAYKSMCSTITEYMKSGRFSGTGCNKGMTTNVIMFFNIQELMFFLKILAYLML